MTGPGTPRGELCVGGEAGVKKEKKNLRGGLVGVGG